MWSRKNARQWTAPFHPKDHFLPEDIDKEEKEWIRTIHLDESQSEQEGSDEAEVNTTTEFSDQERENEDLDADSTYLGQWEKSLKNIKLQREQEPSHSLKQRQLNLIAAGVKHALDDIDNQEEWAQKWVLQKTRQRWISLSTMREEDGPLLQSVSGPYHPNIGSSREEYFARKKEEEERMLEMKAQECHNNDWILVKETELQDHQSKKDAATDKDTKRAHLYM